MRVLFCCCFFILAFVTEQNNAQDMCSHVSLMQNYFSNSVIEKIGRGHSSIVYVLGTSDRVNSYQLHSLKELLNKYRKLRQSHLKVFIIDPTFGSSSIISQQYSQEFTHVKAKRRTLRKQIGGQEADPCDLYVFDGCGRLSTVLKSPYSVVRWYPGALRNIQRMLVDPQGVCGLCKQYHHQQQQQAIQQKQQKQQGQQHQHQKQHIKQQQREKTTNRIDMKKPNQRTEDKDNKSLFNLDIWDGIERQRRKVEQSHFVKMFKEENEVEPRTTIHLSEPVLSSTQPSTTDPPLVTSKEEKRWLDEILRHTISLPPEPQNNWYQNPQLRTMNNDKLPATRSTEDLWLEQVLNHTMTTSSPYSAGRLKLEEFFLNTKNPEELWLEQQLRTMSPEEVWLENKSTMIKRASPPKAVYSVEPGNARDEKQEENMEESEESFMMRYFMNKWLKGY